MSMLAARLAARLHGRRGLTWLRERHAECPESEVCTRRLPLWCGGTRGWVVTTRSRHTEYGASTREVGNSKPGNRSSLGPWSHDPAPRPTAPQRRHASDELLTQDTRPTPAGAQPSFLTSARILSGCGSSTRSSR